MNQVSFEKNSRCWNAKNYVYKQMADTDCAYQKLPLLET